MLPTTARKAGPYSCNGSVVDFDFAFKVYTTDDIRVVKTTSAGVESDLTLTSQYTVSLNADQDNDPGGTITTVATYASGNKITIVGDTDYGQPTDITNRGGFYPDVIMKMVDRVVIMCQQLKEGLDRSVKVDVSSTTDPADLLDDITTSVAAAAASETAAASSASAASASAVAADASADAAAASAAAITLPLPVASGGTGSANASDARTALGIPALKLSAFAATSSSELRGVMSDETGSGALVFADTPTLVTPEIGAATGSSLNLSGLLTAAGLRVTGSVLQVVAGTSTTSTQTTSATYADTTLTATITPKATTSKILVLVTQPYRSSRNADSTNGYIQLQRDGSALQTTGEMGLETAAGTLSVVQGVCAMAYLDSPGSTSALTYKTQAKVGVALNSASLTTQYGGYQSNIILVEIGG